MQISPYLTFDGQAAEALEFYAEAFGGTVEGVTRFDEMPDHSMIPDSHKSGVANGTVRLRSKRIMISDTGGMQPFQPPQGFSIHMEFETPEEARAAWDRIMEGGTAQMPLDKTFWARLFGTMTDKYGVSWMVSCT